MAIFGQQAQTILIVQPKVPKFTKKLFPSLLIILSPITFSKIHRDFKPDIFPTSIFFRIVHHSAREKTSKGQFLEFFSNAKCILIKPNWSFHPWPIKNEFYDVLNYRQVHLERNNRSESFTDTFLTLCEKQYYFPCNIDAHSVNFSATKWTKRLRLSARRSNATLATQYDIFSDFSATRHC